MNRLLKLSLAIALCASPLCSNAAQNETFFGITPEQAEAFIKRTKGSETPDQVCALVKDLQEKAPVDLREPIRKQFLGEKISSEDKTRLIMFHADLKAKQQQPIMLKLNIADPVSVAASAQAVDPLEGVKLGCIGTEEPCDESRNAAWDDYVTQEDEKARVAALEKEKVVAEQKQKMHKEQADARASKLAQEANAKVEAEREKADLEKENQETYRAMSDESSDVYPEDAVTAQQEAHAQAAALKEQETNKKVAELEQQSRNNTPSQKPARAVYDEDAADRRREAQPVVEQVVMEQDTYGAQERSQEEISAMHAHLDQQEAVMHAQFAPQAQVLDSSSLESSAQDAYDIHVDHHQNLAVPGSEHPEMGAFAIPNDSSTLVSNNQEKNTGEKIQSGYFGLRPTKQQVEQAKKPAPKKEAPKKIAIVPAVKLILPTLSETTKFMKERLAQGLEIDSSALMHLPENTRASITASLFADAAKEAAKTPWFFSTWGAGKWSLALTGIATAVVAAKMFHHYYIEKFPLPVVNAYRTQHGLELEKDDENEGAPEKSTNKK